MLFKTSTLFPYLIRKGITEFYTWQRDDGNILFVIKKIHS